MLKILSPCTAEALDINVILEAVDNVVHLRAPVVAHGLDLIVLLRSDKSSMMKN